MNQHINALLGPLEAATRQGSWEDAEDIAREISRLARLERLSELQKIEEAVEAYREKRQIQNAILASRGHLNPYRGPKTPPGGSQVAKTPLPVASPAPIKQGESTLIPSALTAPQPSWDEQWPFG